MKASKQQPGVFASGDKVEVLSSEDGFSDAWATATVVSQKKGMMEVEYSKFVDSDGKQLREKVRATLGAQAGEETRSRPAALAGSRKWHRRPATDPLPFSYILFQIIKLYFFFPSPRQLCKQ